MSVNVDRNPVFGKPVNRVALAYAVFYGLAAETATLEGAAVSEQEPFKRVCVRTCIVLEVPTK